MTPYQVARRMVRARTPVDAGLIVAYLQHEADLAGVDLEDLATFVRLTSALRSLDAFVRVYTRVAASTANPEAFVAVGSPS